MIRAGDIVPLSLQISDGNNGLSIAVKVVSQSRKIIFSGSLKNQESGLYTTQEFLMPSDIDWVIAQYEPDSDEYEMASEIFYRDKSALPLTAAQFDSILKENAQPILSKEDVQGILEEKFPSDDGFFAGSIEFEENTDDGFMEGTISEESKTTHPK